MKYDKSELLIIWLDSIVGLDYKNKNYLYSKAENSSSISGTIKANSQYLISALGQEKYLSILNSATDEYLKNLLDGYEKREITVITIKSLNYPNLLRELSSPPLALYAKGDVSLLDTECFSIVGARKSLPLSVAVAKDYAKGLIDGGFTIVTGIAEGVEKAVIETALERGGKIISVMASGIDKVYPASHKELATRIKNSGLILSEYPPNVSAMPYFFPLRNRIIAGLSKGTLIISAGKKSGTMYTAEYATELSRELFAVPYSVGIESGAGCNELIKKGAILTDEVDDILNFYGKTLVEKVFLTEEESQIANALRDGALHVEVIAQKLNKQIFEISPIISILEIKGVIYKAGNNVFGLSKTFLED